MPTQDKHSSHIRRAEQVNSLAYKLTKTQQLPNTSAHQLTNSRIHQLINSKFHRLTNSLTHQLRKLKLLFFILQYRFNFHFVLARILAKKQVNRYYFQTFTRGTLSIFKNKSCILHHFTFLVWSPARNFSSPKKHFQPPKPHFLMPSSPFLALFFMAL